MSNFTTPSSVHPAAIPTPSIKGGAEVVSIQIDGNEVPTLDIILQGRDGHQQNQEEEEEEEDGTLKLILQQRLAPPKEARRRASSSARPSLDGREDHRAPKQLHDLFWSVSTLLSKCPSLRASGVLSIKIAAVAQPAEDGEPTPSSDAPLRATVAATSVAAAYAAGVRSGSGGGGAAARPRPPSAAAAAAAAAVQATAPAMQQQQQPAQPQPQQRHHHHHHQHQHQRRRVTVEVVVKKWRLEKGSGCTFKYHTDTAGADADADTTTAAVMVLARLAYGSEAPVDEGASDKRFFFGSLEDTDGAREVGAPNQCPLGVGS